MISLLKLPARLILCCVFLAAAPAFGAIVYLDSFGSAGSGDGQFGYPVSLAVAANGDVYVVGTGNRVQRFDSAGTYLSQWGTSGNSTGQFSSPGGIAVGPDGSVYVCDTGNNRVQRFGATGNFISTWGSYGSDVGQLSDANGIAVAANGTVYVTEEGNDRIQKFNADGSSASLFANSLNGLHFNPSGIAVADNGSVFVSYSSSTITEFGVGGAELNEWGTNGTGPGELKIIHGIDVSAAGQVYVVDYGTCRVSRFDMQGNYQTQIGVQGSGDGEFSYPSGVTVAESGLVYVADTSNRRIQRFFDADAWTGYYPIDDDASTSGMNDATIDTGTPIGSSLMVGTGRNLGVAGNLRIASGGILQLDSTGRIACGTLENAGTFTWNGGTLGFNGDLTINSTTPFGATGGDTISAGRNLEVAGSLNVVGVGSLALDGGTLFIGSDAVTPTAANTIAIGAGGTLFVDGSTASLVVGGKNGENGGNSENGENGENGGLLDIRTGGHFELTDSASASFQGGNGGEGGEGRKCGGDGGDGANGARLTISGGQFSLDGTFNGNGGNGGNGNRVSDGGDCGDGGDGASGAELTISGGLFSLDGTFNGDGGDGGDGGDFTTDLGANGGSGGSGASLTVSGGQFSLDGTFNGDGGDGGDSTTSVGADGSNGGSGARLTISGGQFSLDGTFNGNGGNGGMAGMGSYSGGFGGDGASGARLTVSGGRFSLNGTFNGTGGTGGTGGGNSGDGGDGGNIHLLGGEMILAATATIDLSGGNGGDGVYDGSEGQRGVDGTLELDGGTLIFDGANLDDVLVAGNFVWKTGTVRLTGDRTVDSIMEVGIIPSTLAANQTLQIEKTLTFSTGDVLDPSDGSIVVGDVVTSFSPGMICVCNNGTIDMTGGTLTADRVRLEQGGILHIAGGIFNSPPPEMAGGTFIRDSGHTFTSGQTLTGYGAVIGDVYAEYGSRIVATGDLTLGDAASFTGFVGDGRLKVDDHTVTISSRAVTKVGSLVSIDGGILNVANGFMIDATGMLVGAGTINGQFINQGLVAAGGPGEELTFNGLVSGAGSFTGSLIFNGGFSPGNSPTIQHFDWLTLTENNTLTMELGGLIAGEEYDQLIINELLTIGGSLDVELLGGFTPELGDTFTLFDGLLAGNFAEVNLPGLGDGMSWDYSALCTLGTLTVVPEPSTLLLTIIGLLGAAFFGWRRNM